MTHPSASRFTTSNVHWTFGFVVQNYSSFIHNGTATALPKDVLSVLSLKCRWYFSFGMFVHSTLLIENSRIVSLCRETDPIDEKHGNAEQLQFELSQLKRAIFGSKSERFVPDAHPSQGNLFVSVWACTSTR